MKNKIRFLTLALILFPALIFSSCKKKSIEVRGQYAGDVRLWNHTFASSSAYTIPEKFPRAIIIPHHDICTFRQNSFYKALSEKAQPALVVLISPDHFERGKKEIVAPVSEVIFKTTDGNLELDKNLLKKLSKSSISSHVDFAGDLWKEEHGAFIHAPFIHHYFPNAKFLPLLLKPLSTDEDFSSYAELADFLCDNLPDDALLVASVDFSHYQIPEMTNLHDEVSLNTIANFEDPRPIEIDSPESVFTLMEYCRKKGAVRPVIVDRSSTYGFIPDEFVESTSHQYWAFYMEEDSQLIESYYYKMMPMSRQRVFVNNYNLPNQTIVIGGSGDLGVGLRTRWDWDRYRTSTDPGEINLRSLAGKEARFLMGFDAYIFDMHDGDFFERTLHGTNLKVDCTTLQKAATMFDEGRWNTGMPDEKSASPASLHVSVLIHDAFSSFLPDDGLIEKLAMTRDALIIRENIGMSDSSAYFYDGTKVEKINLGIMKSADGTPIEGNVLAVNWASGRREIHTFHYESYTGLVPAIHQFWEEE